MALEPVGVWSTTDLGSAAYAHSRNLPIRQVRRTPQGVVFTFDDPKGLGPRLKIEFANSPERRYDESVRTLKKLAFENVPR